MLYTPHQALAGDSLVRMHQNLWLVLGAVVLSWLLADHHLVYRGHHLQQHPGKPPPQHYHGRPQQLIHEPVVRRCEHDRRQPRLPAAMLMQKASSRAKQRQTMSPLSMRAHRGLAQHLAAQTHTWSALHLRSLRALGNTEEACNRALLQMHPSVGINL